MAKKKKNDSIYLSGKFNKIKNPKILKSYYSILYTLSSYNITQFNLISAYQGHFMLKAVFRHCKELTNE